MLNIKVMLIAMSALIAGCSSNPAVTFHSPVSGATLIEKGTGKTYGTLPIRIEYIWNAAYVNYRGCLQVNGVDVVWPSGHRAATEQIIELCQGVSEYNVGIPYTGNQTQALIDLQHAQTLEYQRQVQDQQTAAMITAISNGLTTALYPTSTYKPAPMPVVSTPAPASAQNPTTNTYTNDRNQFCSGFEEGYRSIKGSLAIVPLCPLMPIIPIGSTTYREGLLAGQRSANN